MVDATPAESDFTNAQERIVDWQAATAGLVVGAAMEVGPARTSPLISRRAGIGHHLPRSGGEGTGRGLLAPFALEAPEQKCSG